MNYKEKINALAEYLEAAGAVEESGLVIRLASVTYIDFWEPSEDGTRYKPYAFRYHYSRDEFEVLQTKEGNGIGKIFGPRTSVYRILKGLEDKWALYPVGEQSQETPRGSATAPTVTSDVPQETSPVGAVAAPAITAAEQVLWESDGTQRPWPGVRREVMELIQRLDDGTLFGRERGAAHEDLSLARGLVDALGRRGYYGNVRRLNMTRRDYLLSHLEGAILKTESSAVIEPIEQKAGINYSGLSEDAKNAADIMANLARTMGMPALVMTSAFRGSAHQAGVMYHNYINNGGDENGAGRAYLIDLYRDDVGAAAIADCFEGKDRSEAVSCAAIYLESNPISNHALGIAFDLRNTPGALEVAREAVSRGLVDARIGDETRRPDPHVHVKINSVSQDGLAFLQGPRGGGGSETV